MKRKPYQEDLNYLCGYPQFYFKDQTIEKIKKQIGDNP